MRTLLLVSLLIVLQFAFCIPVTAQSRPGSDVIPTEFAQSDQRLILAVGTSMHSHPELYFYLCQDENGRKIVRALRNSTVAPGGKFPERIPIKPDIELTRFGALPQPKAEKYLNDLCLQHNQRRAAGITKSDRPPPFMVGGFGPAPAGALAPPATKTMNATRQPERIPAFKSPAQREYGNLAMLATQDYRTTTGLVNPQIDQTTLKRIHDSAAEPKIKTAAYHLLSVADAERKLFAEAKQRRDSFVERSNELRERAMRGDFVRRETRTTYDTDGSPITYEVEVDDGFFHRIQGLMGVPHLVQTDEGLAQSSAVQAMRMLEEARLEVWRELLPLAPGFSGPASSKPIVSVRYHFKAGPTRPYSGPAIDGFSYSFDGKYLAKNISESDLHHVTLVVDWKHFTTFPKAAVRHVHYIPLWKKNAEIELSRVFIADKKLGSDYHEPVYGRNEFGMLRPHGQLNELSGVMEVTTSLCSNQARQPPVSTLISERAAKVSRQLLAFAYELLEGPDALQVFLERSAATKEGLKNLPPGMAAQNRRRIEEQEKQMLSALDGTQAKLDKMLRPVILAMPKKSPEYFEAERLLKDYQQVRRERAKAQAGGLLAACAEGERYVGDWFGPGAGGKLGLLFVACDAEGKNIRAEIFDAKNPERRRLVAGSIAQDRPNHVAMVMFEPVMPDEGVVTGEANELRTNLLHPSVKSYRFQLRDGCLRGDASGVRSGRFAL